MDGMNGAESVRRASSRSVAGLLWAVVVAHLVSAVMSALRHAFGLPPLLVPGSLRRVAAAQGVMMLGAAGPRAGTLSHGRERAWPLPARRHAALVLRGGAREFSVGGARELSVASVKLRGAAETASGDSDDGGARAKQLRGSNGGDLVDVCKQTGAELRRRSRGRGRSLAGYALKPNGDWVRIVDKPEAPPAAGAQARQQTTLSPFLVSKHASGAQAGHSEDDDSLESQPDQPVGGSPTVADQIQMIMGCTAINSDVDIPPLDEALWEELPSKWVVFSDLHVSRSSLDTCLRVLQAVHDEAMARGAGVIFLGDFWHEKGILRVESLNSILLALRTWKLPLIALPGNHDQSTLNGQVHALTPLALVMPGCRIISQPTFFLGALWMPYCRDLQILRSAMAEVARDEAGGGGAGAHGQVGSWPMRGRAEGKWIDDGEGSVAASRGVSAIFCHVDVIGADMSGGMMAERGLGVEEFPGHVPVYTGHYHKPHSLWGKPGARQHPVVYVGSQWQTGMNEAHEAKRLLLLDASKGWTIAEEIPVSIGRRHFRALSLAQLDANLLSWALRKGDRVQVRVADAAGARLKAQQMALPDGVSLEVVEQPVDQIEARVPGADTLDAMSLLHRYFEYRDRAGAEDAGPAADEETRHAAETVLKEAINAKPPAAHIARDIVFETVEVCGFGSFGFERPVRYPTHTNTHTNTHTHTQTYISN